MYYSLKEKYDALINDVEERHKKGQPVLIGTSSVEVSEYLSSLIKKRGIKHEVLNAKNNAREAEIVALAGQKGAVTIATNMAGRGTDIKLGEGVRELGGLAVIGSERNDSRRVDNQLRGRSGRQGDPGYSKFYVSIQDNLMKHFDEGKLENNALLKNHLQGDSINSGFLTKMLSMAQLRVEGARFDYRKYLLKYDEVLREQREIMYKRRDEILACQNPKDIIIKLYGEASEYLVEHSITEIDGDMAIDERRLEELIKNHIKVYINFPDGSFDGCEVDEVKIKVRDTLIDALEQKYKMIPVDQLYAEHKKIALSIFDRHWTKHIDDMDKFHRAVEYLKYEQKDPINTYTNRGFEMFEEANEHIALEVAALTLNLRIIVVSADPHQTNRGQGDVIDV